MATIPAKHLALVAMRMPHLSRLGTSPKEQNGIPTFPSKLTKLWLSMFHEDACGSAQFINSCIMATGCLQSLQSITLSLARNSVFAAISFAPFVGLPKPQAFKLHCDGCCDLTERQIEEIRSLTQVRELVVTGMDTAPMLERLFKKPHRLTVQKLDNLHNMDDDAVALLSLIPSLTELHFANCISKRFDFLTQLPHLTELSFVPRSKVHVAHLVIGLKSCTRLLRLSLASYKSLSQNMMLSPSDLAAFLPHLVRLENLKIVDVVHLDTLEFLTRPPLIHTLTSLTMGNCGNMDLAELHHVHALHSLQHLDIVNCFSTELNAFTLALYSPPPSFLMPSLISFSCCRRRQYMQWREE